MRILIIEDEADFIERVAKAIKAGGEELLTPTELGLSADDFFTHDGGLSIEEQLTAFLFKAVKDAGVDLVLLDTDLSRNRTLRTQTEYRQAFRQIGLPVCRYRKKARETRAQALEQLHRLAVDGATAIFVPHELVSGDGPENSLVPWLREIHAGFSHLCAELQGRPEVLNDSLGPAGILAELLGRRALFADFLGYTAQNSMFFAETVVEDADAPDQFKLLSTRLGYWLVNYILAFPGPILNRAAAAAFLNLSLPSFEDPRVLELVGATAYRGPFAGLAGGHYWYEDLVALRDRVEGDIAKSAELAGIALSRVDESERGEAYYCVLHRQPIPANDAAPSPDWIPSGAGMTRISRGDLEQLGPMLNI